jgi:hypothetical protein
VRLEDAGHQSWEELPSATTLDLEPGDTLIFSAHMLHRGTYDGNDSRLSVDLMVGKSHPAIPITLDLQELPTAGDLAALCHSQWFARARKLLLESPK